MKKHIFRKNLPRFIKNSENLQYLKQCTLLSSSFPAVQPDKNCSGQVQPGTEGNWRNLTTLSFSLRSEGFENPTSSTPIFNTCTWDMSLPNIKLGKPMGFVSMRPIGYTLNWEIVFKGLLCTHLAVLQDPVQKQLTEKYQFFCERGLFAYLPGCGPRGRLLIKHTPKGL